MRERSFGRIVNIGSINGQAGQYGQVNYAAAKSGIHGFTKALAQEGAAKGITVNAIAPGYIDTDMVRAVPRERAGEDRRPDPGRPSGQGVGDRPRRAVPGRRRGRLHHRLDPVDQRRAAHVLIDHPFCDGQDPRAPIRASKWCCCWNHRIARRALDRDELPRPLPTRVRSRHRRAASRSRRCSGGSTRCAGSWCPATSSAWRRRPA